MSCMHPIPRLAVHVYYVPVTIFPVKRDNTLSSNKLPQIGSNEQLCR